MAERIKNRAKALLRRSTEKQEMSLTIQLAWAVRIAGEMGLKFDACEADLEHMLSNRLYRYKDLYIDNGISGSDMSRAGLQAMVTDCLADKSISHLLCMKADRFARAEEPLEAVLQEIKLRSAGLTIVYSDRTANPRQAGQNNLIEDLVAHLQFSEASNEVVRLSERVLDGLLKAAKEGASSGGRASYGFKRVLVRTSDNKVLQDLADGAKVRQAGCRVKHQPADEKKIATRVKISQLYFVERWGGTRIANYLNDEGIPSPDAGRYRTRHGVRYIVPGKWTSSTVLGLIRNIASIGMSSFGVRSRGRLRRIGQGGLRSLEDHDRDEKNHPKIVKNSNSVVVSATTGFTPIIDVETFEGCRTLLDERGKNQRGVSRRGDAVRYPMRLRIFDMSDQCGSPMYAKTHGKQVTYACSKYMRSSGKECNRNAVDGEAAFQFTLAFLRRNLNRLGAREALRARLEKIAAADQADSAPNPLDSRIQDLETSLLAAERELAQIKHNLARTAKEDLIHAPIAEEYAAQRGKVLGIQVRLTEAKASRPTSKQIDPDMEIQAALALFDQLEVVATDATARGSASKFFEDINLRLWLNFRDGVKGKRKVRILTGGVVTTGNGAMPVSPYGLNKDYSGQHDGDGMLPTPSGNQLPCADLVSLSEGVSLPIGDHGVP